MVLITLLVRAREQPARPDQLHAVGACLLNQLLGQFLLIHVRRHGLDAVRASTVLPAKLTPGVSDQLHRS